MELVKELNVNFLFAECQPGFFKDVALDNKCKPCPANTQRQAAGAQFCPCMNGFYRAASDPPSGPCSGTAILSI